MCSNQKGRQLSAFLLLAPLRNVELPEIVVLPGNVEPPGNVVLPGNVEPPLGTSSTSSMTRTSQCSPPPGNPETLHSPATPSVQPSMNVEFPGNVEHQLDGADYSSLSAAYLREDPSPCPHSTTASPQPASPAPPLPDWNECSALPQPDDAHRGYSDPNNLASRRAHPAAPDPAVRYAPPPSGHCRTSSFALCAPASNGIRSGHARGSA